MLGNRGVIKGEKNVPEEGIRYNRIIDGKCGNIFLSHISGENRRSDFYD